MYVQSRPTLCNPMDCSLPGSCVHGILQARILEWVAISFSRESSGFRDWTRVSCIAGRFFTIWAIIRSLGKILEWVAISFSRGSSGPRDWTCVSCVSCIGSWFFTTYSPWHFFSDTEEHSVSSVQLLSHVWLFVTPWIAERQASLSITNSQSLPKLTSIELVMPSSHLILCRPLLLLAPIPPSIRVFSSESTLHMRWPKNWSFSFSISPSNEEH